MDRDSLHLQGWIPLHITTTITAALRFVERWAPDNVRTWSWLGQSSRVKSQRRRLSFDPIKRENWTETRSDSTLGVRHGTLNIEFQLTNLFFFIRGSRLTHMIAWKDHSPHSTRYRWLLRSPVEGSSGGRSLWSVRSRTQMDKLAIF